MALSSKIYAAVTATLTGTDDLGTLQYTLPMTTLFQSLASGTGDDQADLLFTDTRTIAASSSENLDLAGTSLHNPFGTALTFATVKVIYIKASADNTNDVVVGGAGSNTFDGPFVDDTDQIAIHPGGVFLVASPDTGWTVDAGTGDILKVANSSSGTGVTYDIVIIGTSA